ncbi:Reverse transcriptase domain [Cinara cedri]|uniref:Reverse transcriptase domain n=1 Tax=Cinara cedri TaxID=506608 RepID=A0A5E4MLC4_9HEMI|nr:Reverse transcriptase domain [Cinara cedri]
MGLRQVDSWCKILSNSMNISKILMDCPISKTVDEKYKSEWYFQMILLLCYEKNLDKKNKLRQLTIARGGIIAEVAFDEEKRQTVTCGAPQGSVLEPLLWNVIYNDLLRVDFRETTRLSSSTFVAFANNVAVETTGHITSILEEIMNRILELVSKWMEDNGLKLPKS